MGFSSSDLLLAAWLHFSALCLFNSVISVWVQLLLAKFPTGFTWLFFSLKKKEQILSSYPCIIWQMSNCRLLRICTREGFIKLQWEKGGTHQFVPETYHGYWLKVVKFCQPWPHRTRRKFQKMLQVLVTKNMRVERSLLISECFYEQIQRMQKTRGRTSSLIYCLTCLLK